MDELSLNRKRLAELEDEVELLTRKNQKLEDVITTFRKRSNELETKLSVDQRSGLANHHRLAWELPERMKRAKDSNRSLTLYIIRLDSRYSMLSRTMKPTVGEWILYQTGQRLKDNFAEGYDVYHSREDEFIVIGESPAEETEERKVTLRIADLIEQPHLFSGYRVSLGSYIGVARFPEHGMDSHLLMRAADLALESAHTTGKKFMVFSEKIRASVVERMELQSAILKALESQAILEISRQFELYLQPIVGIRVEEGIVSVVKVDAEVLIRWNHPERGMIGPDMFIPTAEETGLIIPIGNWVLYKSVELLEGWRGGEFGMVGLSVNISTRQFHDDQLVDIVTSIMRSKPGVAERLKLEITESCLMEDPQQAVSRMEKLKAEGAIFSVDDFGTGYSSLSYLSKLPVSTLKIDRSFVRNAPRSYHDLAIVRAIVALGRELKLQVVCEGVETFDQVETLFREGCTSIQGYFFARPMPISQFETWAREAMGKTYNPEGK